MDQLVVRALQERGVDGRHGHQPLFRHAGGHGHRVFLGDACVKKPLRELLRKTGQPRAVRHGGGERRHAPVPLGYAAERVAEFSGKIAPAALDDARLAVEGAHAVVFIRMQLGEGVPPALFCQHMHEHRRAHVPRPGDGALQRRDIVPVHRAKVVESQVVEHVPGQHGLFHALLYMVDGVIERLHAAHGGAVPALETDVARLHPHAGEQPRHAADIAADGHRVVVEYDDQRLTGLPGVRQPFVSQPAGERAVADDGHDVVISPQARPRPGHAQRHGDGVRSVAGDESVRCALPRLGEAGDAAGLAQALKARAPPGEQLVRVALMPHVEYDAVAHGVVHAVQRHCQFHRPQVGGQVAARPGNGGDQELAYLRAEPGQLALREAAKVLICFDFVKYMQKYDLFSALFYDQRVQSKISHY